jgi:uncharacterized protein YneF (UPF0154 family)
MSLNKLTKLNLSENIKSLIKSLFLKQGEIIDYLKNNPPYTPSYKVYTALLTQEGENAPEAIVLENTIGNITWNYAGVGLYGGILNGAFINNKTFTSPPGMFNGPEDGIKVARGDNDTIEVSAGSNGVLQNTAIEIRVYN